MMIRYQQQGTRTRLTRSTIGLILFGILLSVALSAGCGRLEITGKAEPNNAPNVVFANIPAGGARFSANPIVYWYGTDVDGRVVRYDYAVVPETTVQRFVEENPCNDGVDIADRFAHCAEDKDFDWISIFVDSIASNELSTQQTVQLFASFDTLDCDSQVIAVPTPTFHFDTVPFNCTSKYVPQFMFIRAVDELGKASQIKYRSYLRNNHWPETAIDREFELASRTAPFYSLPELTPTYRGILVNYGGSDRQDFLRDEPPLEFYWRVYGPYSYRPTDISDTLWGEDGGALYGQPRVPIIGSQSDDPRRGVWVRDTVATVFNLFKDAGQSDTTRSAYFLIVVTARDDAFVPDPVPDMVAFEAIDPKFERDIMLVADGLYIPGNWGTPTCRPGSKYSGDPKCNHEFLLHIAETAAGTVKSNPSGFDLNKDWFEYEGRGCQKSFTPASGCINHDNRDAEGNVVPMGILPIDLARHKLVIYDKMDITTPPNNGLGHEVLGRLTRYLDIGGKVWLISRIPFFPSTITGDKTTPQLVDFEGVGGSTARISRDYFDMEAAWWPGWKSGLNQRSAQESKSNDEFVGANLSPDLVGTSLPEYISVDHERIDSAYVLTMRDVIAPATIYGAPNVPYVVRGSRSRTVYRFDSYRPALNNAQGGVVSMRFVGPNLDTPRFKTAWFGCPLYWIEQDDAEALTRGMVDWFLNQPLQVP